MKEKLARYVRPVLQWFRIGHFYGFLVWWHCFRSKDNHVALHREDKAQLDLVTISFNNPVVVQHQIRLLRQNLQDPFTLTVFDNSRDSAAQAEIAGICQEQGIQYFTLPQRRRYTKLNPSDSHGRALNWTYRLYLKKRDAAYIGFLDHDIFPIRPIQVIPQLEQRGAYGPLKIFGERWYIWAGLCFFTKAFLAVRSPDFMPTQGLDTGGGNYDRLFKNCNKDAFFDPKLNLETVETVTGNGSVWMMGDWMHTGAASGWNGLLRGTPDWAAEFLPHY